MKILFADDTADTRFLYQLGLKIAGHEVHLAGDGLEAIQAVREQNFDIIVMDLDMPGMSGWEAIHVIRQMEKGCDVPIVILSAYYSTKYADRVQLEKVSMVLSKPIMPEQLVLLLEGLFEKKCDERSERGTENNDLD